MSSILRCLLAVLVVLVQLSATPAQADAVARAQEIAAPLLSEHPAALLQAAAERFDAGQRAEGVYLFYLGQLRWRRYITARPDLPADREPALFASVLQVAGPGINEWAFGDIDWLVATLRALDARDAATPDLLTPVAKFPDIHVRTREGFVAFIDRIEAEADDHRAARAAAGLENR